MTTTTGNWRIEEEEEEEEEGRFSKEGRRIFPRDKGKGGMAPNREKGRAEMQQL